MPSSRGTHSAFPKSPDASSSFSLCGAVRKESEPYPERHPRYNPAEDGNIPAFRNRKTDLRKFAGHLLLWHWNDSERPLRTHALTQKSAEYRYTTMLLPVRELKRKECLQKNALFGHLILSVLLLKPCVFRQRSSYRQACLVEYIFLFASRFHKNDDNSIFFRWRFSFRSSPPEAEQALLQFLKYEEANLYNPHNLKIDPSRWHTSFKFVYPIIPYYTLHLSSKK